MSKIDIQLFGRFCVQRDGQLVAGLGTCKLQELFSYILLHRYHPLSREALAGLFWPDIATAQSKKKLRQLLWHLQSALGSQTDTPHHRLFLIDPDQVQVNPEADFWLDVAIFEKAFECVQGITGQHLDTLRVQTVQNAILLYRGPLMEGCYEDWCLYQRERLQGMYLALLEKLMNDCEVQHNYDTGIRYGMQIINCDRVHERIYRYLMYLHYLNGDRAKALHLYKQCSLALEEELGVKPSKRTVTLYKQILAEQLGASKPPFALIDTQSALECSNTPLNQVLGHLTHLQRLLAELQIQVQQSMHCIELTLSKNSTTPSMKVEQEKDDPETLRRPSEDTTTI